jgi:hypothetical protein
MKFNLRPRPSGEAARVVFTDYAAPADPDVGMPYKVLTNNGTDWTLGTLSDIYPGFGVHDAWIEARHVSLYEKDGQTNVVIPSYRTQGDDDDVAKRSRTHGDEAHVQ